ncbi:unnamed protein product [Toxocara canis]|uniref:Quinolinate synthase n=1 Tax=Toxocara canis TaxID=6265 RepID=A0A183U499_TOXCA|nr:unnamed protein product [Toxocara canis]
MIAVTHTKKVAESSHVNTRTTPLHSFRREKMHYDCAQMMLDGVRIPRVKEHLELVEMAKEADMAVTVNRVKDALVAECGKAIARDIVGMAYAV